MKYFLILALLILTLNSTFLTQNSYAHLAGQPPYFRVNGIFTDYYPVPTSSIPDFNLPQDIARDTYLVNEKIDFEIDQKLLPIPEEITQKTAFFWDFGDGEKAEGLKNSHAYKKPGSYVLVINATTQSDPKPQLIQSMLLNISLSKDFKLPKALFKVNNFQSKDPLTDILNTSLRKDLKFDASISESSSPITEYLWDFGDGTTGKGSKVTHKYTNNPYTVFPVLRIKTADGFISDAFMQITDENSYDVVSAKNKMPQENPIAYLYLGLLGFGILGSILYIIKKTGIKNKK